MSVRLFVYAAATVNDAALGLVIVFVVAVINICTISQKQFLDDRYVGMHLEYIADDRLNLSSINIHKG